LIPREFIEEIKYRNDIVDVIGSYVTLKRAGTNYNGLCPFHSEKTPSFTVFPKTASFYCFGCGAGGEVISFIEKAENVNYPDAVELLAKRVGLTVPQDASARRDNEVSRKRVLEMNVEAAKYFRTCLFDPNVGAPGMAYLSEKRRLSAATIKRFGLGFAPDNFGGLITHLSSLGYTEEEMIQGYLAKRHEKTNRLYALFRNRVMYPIFDTAMNIVAFGGRVMDDSKPKYLNSSDTPGFKKSKQLFALNYAKDSPETPEYMILCEGYMDVIALHAAGFENAVATLGTAITGDQARIFAKYTKKVIISYDSDDAGQNAAKKAMRLLNEAGLDVRVLRMNGAKDPDEFIKTFGPEKFRQVLDSSQSGFHYQMDTVLLQHPLDTPEDKIKAADEICAVIAGYRTPVEREIYTGEAAKRLELSADVIKNSVNMYVKRKLNEEKRQEEHNALNTVHGFGDRVNLEAATHLTAAAAEEAILGFLLLDEAYRDFVDTQKVNLTADDFVTSFGRRVFEEVMRQHNEGGFLYSAMGETFSVDEMARVEKMLHERDDLNNSNDAFRSYVDCLKQENLAKDKLGNDDVAQNIAFLRQQAQDRKNKRSGNK